MSILVCDAIMGSGKSSAAINMMNDNPDEKYIYITPFLDETERIQKACPKLNFVIPRDDLSKHRYLKREHIKYLIGNGKNIATTHQSYLNFDNEMLKTVQNQKYILIIDESLEVYGEEFNISKFITSAFSDRGIVEYSKGNWIIKHNNISKEMLSTMPKMCLELLSNDKENKNIYSSSKDTIAGFFSNINKDSLCAFKDVYILTYMFEGQELSYFFQLNNLQYENIYINKNKNNEYVFSKQKKFMPEYTQNLHEMIDICEIDKLNNIGYFRFNRTGSRPFSSTFLQNKRNNSEFIKKAKSNLNSWFTYYNSDIPSEQRLWSTVLSKKEAFSGKGYIKSFLSFNSRATNKYSDRTCLAYLIDIYMNPFKKNALMHNGIKVDEDKYALSIMIQWIWRSAIRNGKKIRIYIPNRRMRELLKNWIKNTEQEAREVII